MLLHTSFGDIDVELWSREAPKACRNFVQLALEGVICALVIVLSCANAHGHRLLVQYYDNTIFHRIVRKFMVQGGDPTGTGTGTRCAYMQITV